MTHPPTRDVPLLAGPAAEWLAARRGDLNQRFERLRRRYPRLDADAALDALARTLPPVAGPEPGAGDLNAAVYDLVLLHVARGTLARPGLATLLGRAFPALRSVLLARPSSLPGALSNAVENLGERGEEYAQRLADLAPRVTTPAALLDLGCVLAWRVGRAPLRAAALEAVGRLDATLAEYALGLDAAQLRALVADAWRHPGGGWREVARAGEFEGFGGAFRAPPTVLPGGDRHSVLVRDGDRDWLLVADVFGATCLAADHGGVPPKAPGTALLHPGTGRAVVLERDGRLRGHPGGDVELPAFAGATSYSVEDGRLVAAFRDSHRVRIATLA